MLLRITVAKEEKKNEVRAVCAVSSFARARIKSTTRSIAANQQLRTSSFTLLLHVGIRRFTTYLILHT